MADINRERRVRWAEQKLAGFPNLTARQRRFLSVLLTSRGWQLFVDRSSPAPVGASTYALGPTGVYALVFTDTVPDRRQLLSLRKHAEETFAGLLSGGSQFVPHMLEVALLMPRAVRTEAHDPFLAVDEATMHSALVTGEHRLSQRRVRDIAVALAERLSGHEWISADAAPTAEAVASESLFAEQDLHVSARDGALNRPFHEWMTFLDPDQLSLVHTNFNGPARISGPAGTGKSVVALHRMAHFAKRHPGRLLFTSFVKTLPAYHYSAFARIAPHAVDRSTFTGLHAWTMTFLHRRGVDYNLDDGARNDALARTWQAVRKDLGRIDGTDYGYWTDEIDRVIEGRGIPDVSTYQAINRTGREGIQLHGNQRKYVWENWYEPYRDRLEERGVHDFNDVIRLAVEELRLRPLDDTEDFALVVVDEVQDFTLMELRLVHLIAGGGPDAQLLLVGDGQQQVYAGGWRLSDAGIPIAGRGRVLRTNYRNRRAVLRYTKMIEAGNTVDDLDGGRGFVLRDSVATLPGGTAVDRHIRRRDVDAELVRAITESGQPISDMSVIVNSRKDAEHYQRVLDRAGFPTLALEKYDGTQLDAIKVGTVHRAKGMDFAAVFHITEEPPENRTGLTGGARDRAELLARQTLVASSRPRDYLWIAYVSD
ncbi:ATP-dependent helicase [Nocardia higoensis]|uniref:ATP-dependent helicase n=1 Tax=Nocardia higoensis TaxID=228599 RepID=A0ABS0DKH0_9NOCA|nr:ATP-dependent helicase [Nocardia higoensis]